MLQSHLEKEQQKTLQLQENLAAASADVRYMQSTMSVYQTQVSERAAKQFFTDRSIAPRSSVSPVRWCVRACVRRAVGPSTHDSPCACACVCVRVCVRVGGRAVDHDDLCARGARAPPPTMQVQSLKSRCADLEDQCTEARQQAQKATNLESIAAARNEILTQKNEDLQRVQKVGRYGWWWLFMHALHGRLAGCWRGMVGWLVGCLVGWFGWLVSGQATHGSAGGGRQIHPSSACATDDAPNNTVLVLSLLFLSSFVASVVPSLLPCLLLAACCLLTSLLRNVGLLRRGRCRVFVGACVRMHPPTQDMASELSLGIPDVHALAGSSLAQRTDSARMELANQTLSAQQVSVLV